MSLPNRRAKPLMVAGNPRNTSNKRPFSTRNRMVGLAVLVIAVMLIGAFAFGGRSGGKKVSPPSSSKSESKSAKTPKPKIEYSVEKQPSPAVIKEEKKILPTSSAMPSPKQAVAPSPSPRVKEQQQTAGTLPYDRTYSAAIVGDWFGGRHHWATGLVQCPSGCKIDFHHDGDTGAVDALLFHGHPNDLRKSDHLLRQAAELKRRQLVLFYAAENFENMDNENFLSQFNGEMSYRVRSIAREVQYPLEAVARLQEVGKDALGDVTEKANYMSKTWKHVMPIARLPRDKMFTAEQGTVCWASNHCNSVSGREGYVRELLQHIKVEIYTAPCLKNAPPEHQNLDWNAQRELWRQYKFYLAFENTRCNDYVTEKFYLALIRGQVPIVIGAANTAEHAPSRDSYVDTRDFATPKALAEYLLYLDKNETAYDEYFAWHDRPFSSYGAAFRRVLEDALPVAQVYGAKDGHVSGRMFSCSVCHDLAIWQAEGRRLDGSVPPFRCDLPMQQQANGAWA